MATELASAYVSVVMEARDLNRQISSEIGKTAPAADRAGRESGKRFSSGMLGGMRGLAGGIGAILVSAGVGRFFKDAVGGASDLQEQGTKLNQVFGKQGALAVQQFGSKGAAALGQSKLAVLEAAGTFGIYGKAAGLSGKANAEFATGFAGLSTDLASFHNAKPEEVVEALGAALRGEAEPMRRFGVLLDDASMRQEALKLGLISTTKDALTPQQKVLAAQSLIYKQTGDAQGDFARTSGGLANQQRILSAQFTDLRAEVGQLLLPIVTKLFSYLTTTAMPALRALVQGFKDGTGAGGQIRAVFDKVTAGARGLFDLIVKGDFSGNLRKAFGWEEDSPIVGKILEIRDTIVDLFAKLKGADKGGIASGLLSKIAQGAKDLLATLPALKPTIDLAARGFQFMSEHVDLVAKAIPFLIAAFAAYKAAQAANNVVGRDSLLGFALQLTQTGLLILANRKLASSMLQVSGAQATQLASTAALNGAESVSLFTRLRTTAATIASTVASKAAAAASKVWAAGQWLLNAALTANPIGLVVLLIAGLVAAFVIAYKKSDTFRAIVQAAWNGIKTAASAVVNWFKGTAWPWMKQAFDWIGEKAKWLWSLVSLQFRIGKAAVEAVVGWIRNTAWPWMRDAFQNIGDKGKWLWNNVLKPTFDLIKTGVGRVKDAFVTAKDGIGTAWSKLEGLAKTPIKFIIQTVLNKGLIAGFNWLSGKIGGPHINDIPLPRGFAAGGVLPGYTPGRDVHRFFNPKLGFLDLSGGEGILRPEATRALGGAKGIAAINSAARQGRGLDVHAHAGGGIIDWIKSKASSAWAWVSDKASDVFRAVTNPLDFLKGKLPKIPGGQTISAYGSAVVDKGLSLGVQKIKDLWKTFKAGFDEIGGVPGSGNAARTVSELTAAVKRILPDTRITSGYRAGSITALGNVSQHSKGLAIDFVPHSPSRFDKVKNAFPNAYQLFYSPRDGQTLLNGKPWRMDSTTKSGHWDHIHLSNKRYAEGGVIPKPLLFDRGGILPEGISLVQNATGAPEPLYPAGRGGDTYILQVSMEMLEQIKTLEDLHRLFAMARVDSRKVASGRVAS